MKELEKFDTDAEKQSIELQVRKQQQKELKYESSLKPRKGHTLWEINESTLEVKPAEFKEEKITDLFKAMDKINKKVIQRPGHKYISALNQENAIERYKNKKGSAGLPMRAELPLV